MRKLLVSCHEPRRRGPHQAFDWPVVDEEFSQFAPRQLEKAGALLFGRVTYQPAARSAVSEEVVL
jgi:hypothetical protein